MILVGSDGDILQSVLDLPSSWILHIVVAFRTQQNRMKELFGNF